MEKIKEAAASAKAEPKQNGERKPGFQKYAAEKACQKQQGRLAASSAAMRETKTLVVLAMCMAVSIVISSFRIRTPMFTVSFGPLVKMYVALLFGPVTGALYGFALDLLQFFIANTGDAFFPGYTFTETLGVFLYGLFFYRRRLTLPRALLGKLAVVIICNIFLGTLWKAMMAGGDVMNWFSYYLPIRTVKNLIQWPVDAVLFLLIARAFAKSGVTAMLSGDAHVSH